ncbi:hypothetical protein BP6252_06703 [Coleophoma cylindrospora]|uniref:Uncharacterized protein n=1 Tax=Coleophoma cylindrospora TaxID=1849047 RepID=A0A3D8RFQ4_9HELO|nr:hypothetical protein BP6252_06703 [Coleophoma cylindrospora]
MESLRKFNVLLQKGIRPDDSAWSYIVPKLPPSEETNSLRLIKSITVLSTPRSQSIKLHFDNAPSNRVTCADPLNLFVVISFANFRLQLPATEAGRHAQPAPSADTIEYISRLLKTGIVLNGTQYHFFGHSNTQLRSRTCVMFAASKSTIGTKIEEMGDFSKLRSVGKKAKRIGLLFSAAEIATVLDPERVEDIDDVQRGNYIYTDGCGFIGTSLAKQLAKQRHIVYRNIKYLPSVYQIRYRGYKGVLMLAPELTGKTLVQFRSSMRKFKDVKDYSLGIVDHSKPYSFGYLNDEIVLLLHALGITTEILLKKQSDFLSFLQAVSSGDIRSTFQFLSFINRFDLGEKLLLEGIGAIFDTVQRLVQSEYLRMLTKRGDQRCRIMILKSRLLFGVCDPSKETDTATKLNPGTCFVRITDYDTGQARTLINTDILVTRNPCLHPGDLQKFRAVDIPEFSHLVDCIVFPTTGNRPSADLMSGGDLDGDRFIVIWDSEIMPRKISEPAVYPNTEEQISFSTVGNDDRADYFARYTDASLGFIKNLHLRWAHLRGPMSAECQQLNRLFSLGVDGNIVRVPAALEDPPEPAADVPPFILDILHSAAKETIEAASQITTTQFLDSPVDAMDLLLSKDSIAVPEFDLVQLTLRWCRRNDQNFLDYACFFNFGALSDEQQRWVLGKLPPTQSGPGIVRNGLLQSKLVLSEELHRFGLDHHNLHWKCVFDSSSDRMGRFMDSTCRTLGLFHKKLIFFRPDERLLIAIYVPNKIAKASEAYVGSTVRVFALPQSQGADSVQYRVKPTTVHYRLYCDESSFQLYDRKRGNTFVFLTRSQIDKSSMWRNKGKGDRRRQKQATIDESMNFDCRASIALDKISKDVQTHVGRINRTGILAAETYVISNRDVQSMAVLDQWLHYVDTEEILPLFGKTHKDYMTTTISGIDCDTTAVSHMALEISRGKNLSILQTIGSLDEVQQLLKLLESCDEYQHLQAVYTELLNLEARGCFLVAQDRPQDHATHSDLAKLLVRFLQTAPYLIPLFFQSQTWTRQKEALHETFTALSPALFKELALAANTFHYTIRQSFLLLLQNLEQLSLHNFAELVELISLVVSDVELAIDLLFECLEPEIKRLLPGSVIEIERIMKCFMGIALNHIDMMSSDKMPDTILIELKLDGIDENGYQVVKFVLRVDAPRPLQVGDHVRIYPSQPPQNAPHQDMRAVDAVVVRSDLDTTSVRCLHRLPSYAEDCLWKITNCKSFVTSKAMFDAVLLFFSQKSKCCKLYSILGGASSSQIRLPPRAQAFKPHATLNSSQNKALEAVLSHNCTFIWGPPGTGTTRTIVAILDQIQTYFKHMRILVAAPTHTAADNILRGYIAHWGPQKIGLAPLRVSTRLQRVASDLREYTCDAIIGQSIAGRIHTRPEAQDRVREARLIFTTCNGAGLGLLRAETFDIVLIDKASQQTEPESLIPLTKGCQRAIFIGDHSQSRAIVRKHAVIADFDVSLFERHYNMRHIPGVSKVMLDSQYRTHPDICDFNSREFYKNQLQSAELNLVLPPSKFPWPKNKRMVFLQSYSHEDLGHQSKSNQGQVKLCQTAYALLQIPVPAIQSGSTEETARPVEIFIVTPYTGQKHLVKCAISGSEVCTIDEYQGRVADIVIFVTVRCNAHLDIGCLQDKRLLNIVMTGAKAGIIIIGDKLTLTGLSEVCHDLESKAIWARLLKSCVQVQL